MPLEQIHVISLSVIGYVFVSISLLFLLITILTYLLQRWDTMYVLSCMYVLIVIIFHIWLLMRRSLWNMRNYIHVMLCANLFAAQLLFVVGVAGEDREWDIQSFNWVWNVWFISISILFYVHIGCLFSHCCVAPLHVSGCVHVDVDGGCGPVCGTGQSVCYTYEILHCCLHISQLW